MKRLILALATLAAFVSTASAQDRLRVVTTTGDLRVLAKAVGAERVIVTSLVPPGERPERYAPRLQETSILKGARVVVRAGTGIDGWFDKLLARVGPEERPQRHRARRERACRRLRRGRRNRSDTGERGLRRAQSPLAAWRGDAAFLARPQDRRCDHGGDREDVL